MTNTGTFVEIVPASGDLYANPAASQQMLDDAMFDVEAWLASEIAIEFARAEPDFGAWRGRGGARGICCFFGLARRNGISGSGPETG